MRIVVRHVDVVGLEEIATDRDVLIEGGEIGEVAAGGSIATRDGDEIVEGADRYLAPGFIDLHFHGTGRFLVDSGPDDVVALCDLLPRYGVTGFLPSVTPRHPGDDVLFLASLASLKPEGSQILAFFLEGPFIALPGAIPPGGLRSPDAKRIGALRDAGAPYPVVFAASPDAEGVLDVIPLMAADRTPVFITHTAATVEETQRGIEAGISHATHFYDVFPCPAEIDPGVRPAGAVEAILADPRVSVDLVLDGEHVHPVVVQMALECKGPDGVCLITDANLGAGLPPGRYQGVGETEIEFAYPGAPARMVRKGHLDGALAGSGLTMDQAVRNAVSLLGLSIPQAVRMASANPARVLGLEESKGRVAPGLAADIVLLDREFNVRQTWIGGNCHYHREQK